MKDGSLKARVPVSLSVVLFNLGLVAVITAIKHLFYQRVPHGFLGVIGKQILLRYVGDILRIFVFCVEMVKRLLFMRAHAFGNRLIPFVGIGEFRINVENNASKWVNPVFYYLANAKFCASDYHG